jgi:hypothetical protein
LFEGDGIDFGTGRRVFTEVFSILCPQVMGMDAQGRLIQPARKLAFERYVYIL